MNATAQQKPLFLISNDDGVHAPGIHLLRKQAERFGDVVVVAPNVERSASSQMITIHNPLRYERLEDQVYAVEGTPADCVMMGLRKLLPRKPDFVLTGINRGANLGQDIMYSGTVGAALEGAMHGVPGLAFSCAGEHPLDYTGTEKIISWMLGQLEALGEFSGVLNINVPSGPADRIVGVRFARPGKRHYEYELVEGKDPRGKAYFWYGGGGTTSAPIADSDCVLMDEGYATITALRTDLFAPEENARLAESLTKPFD